MTFPSGLVQFQKDPDHSRKETRLKLLAWVRLFEHENCRIFVGAFILPYRTKQFQLSAILQALMLLFGLRYFISELACI